MSEKLPNAAEASSSCSSCIVQSSICVAVTSRSLLMCLHSHTLVNA